MQGTRPCPWSGTPHVEKQLSQWATTAKPMLWSPCSGAHALEPISCNYWSPHALEPMLCNKGMCVLSRVRFFVTPWAIAHQSPLPMESSRQEYQGGLPFPTPGDLPDPGIEPASPALTERLYHCATWEAYDEFMSLIMFKNYNSYILKLIYVLYLLSQARASSFIALDRPETWSSFLSSLSPLSCQNPHC